VSVRLDEPEDRLTWLDYAILVLDTAGLIGILWILHLLYKLT
jgi:hypothetical protein